MDKVFLITGGTSGVGEAIATGLAVLGAKVVIISRTAESGQQAVSRLAQVTGNDRAEFLVANLSLQSSIRSVSAEFKRRYEGLHGLVKSSISSGLSIRSRSASCSRPKPTSHRWHSGSRSIDWPG